MTKFSFPLRTRGTQLAMGILTATFAFSLSVGCSCSVGTNSVTVGTKDEVRYSGSATMEEAKALGDSLKQQSYMRDQGVTVALAKGAAGTKLGFVVQDGAWDNEDNYPIFEHMARTAAPTVGGFPITLQYLSTKLEVKKEQALHPYLAVGSDQVGYTGTATEQEAKALADELKKLDYLKDHGTMVILSKGGASGTVVSFVVQDGAWSDEDTVAKFEEIGGEIAPSVGGKPLKVRMLNSVLKKQKDIPVT